MQEKTKEQDQHLLWKQGRHDPRKCVFLQEDVYAGKVSEGLRDVVLQIASAAKAHLDEARALRERVPVEARPLMLPALATDSYLQVWMAPCIFCFWLRCG